MWVYITKRKARAEPASAERLAGFARHLRFKGQNLDKDSAMPRSASFGRSAAFVCLLGGLLCAGAAQAQAIDVRFTGVITGTLGLPGIAVGDTLTGSVSFADGAFAVTSGDGMTESTAYHITTPPLSSSLLTLSNGMTFETGTRPGEHFTEVDLIRDAPNPFPGTNNYAFVLRDLVGPDNPTDAVLLLAVGDTLGTASALFSTPAGDLSLMQPVDWLAAGTINKGEFSVGTSVGLFTITSLAVSAVPEPGTLALLAAGLALVAPAARRRKVA